mmetsp:Transcript_47482/g.93614  ORF Transcript_47482/g.93614 Transcript_47482/m.93614 type:complete len:230 (+) Transcript_47482:1024-1713(+)
MALCENGDGLESGRVIWAHRTQNDVDLRELWSGHAQRGLSCNGGWSNVDGKSVLVWHKLLIDFEEFLDKFNHFGRVKVRQGETRAGSFEPGHVQVRSEHEDLPVLVLVCLHALKTLKRVVERGGSRVKIQILEGVDGRGVPPFLVVPINFQHVVREEATKHKTVQWGHLRGRPLFSLNHNLARIQGSQRTSRREVTQRTSSSTKKRRLEGRTAARQQSATIQGSRPHFE